MRRNYRNRRLVAEDEMVEVMPEASELLFEAEDVAELIAEVTEEDVTVEANEDAAIFTVGEDVFTVEAEGTEEVVESASNIRRGAGAIRASRRRAGRPVSASHGRVAHRPVSADSKMPHSARRPVSASHRRVARRPISANRKDVVRPSNRTIRRVAR